MRVALVMIATAISLAMSGQGHTQVPPQQKNNDASVDGAIRNRGAVEAPAEKAPPINPDAAPPPGPSRETTGSAPPSVTGDAVETETGLGSIMDSDESEAARGRTRR
jgi:hypothetical protein